jgi:hypothetical protein
MDGKNYLPSVTFPAAQPQRVRPVRT